MVPIVAIHNINRQRRGMLWSKTGATHYNAQLGLPDNSNAIKELSVVCYLTYYPNEVIYR